MFQYDILIDDRRSRKTIFNCIEYYALKFFYILPAILSLTISSIVTKYFGGFLELLK